MDIPGRIGHSHAMMNPAFLQSEYPPAADDAAAFHIIPVPYEHSVSYGRGTAQGPAAIIEASQQLEAFDGTDYPGADGIHTGETVDVDAAPEIVMERIDRAVTRALGHGALPVVLGGEHTVSFGAIRAAARHAPGIGVIQVDAHADLRDRYQGSPWSHASVMRRVLDLGLPILQLGVRSLCAEEIAARRQYQVAHLDARALFQGATLAGILPPAFPRRVYLTFDLDGLDAAVMPATGTPEPGGLGFWQALDLVGQAVAGRQVVGLDVVELAPHPAHTHADFCAAKLTYALMGIAQRSRREGVKDES